MKKRSRILPLWLCFLAFGLVLSAPLWADDAVAEPFISEDEFILDPEELDYGFDVYPEEEVWQPLPAQLGEYAARQRLYVQFPHLKNYTTPVMELHHYLMPSGQLSIYSYTWTDQPGLVVEQNANTGELVNYIDIERLNALYEQGPSPDLPWISAQAARSLAVSRFKRVFSEEERGFYPEEPQLELDESGLFIFVWTRHYHGYPNPSELMAIAIHPNTGMPVAVSSGRDFMIAGEVTLPQGQILDEQEALARLSEWIDPVLIDLAFPDGSSQLVWYSNITIDAFDAEGLLLEGMYKETGVEAPEGQELRLDKDAAAQQFRDSLKLSFGWLPTGDEFSHSYFGSPLMLGYRIELVPMAGSPIAVIPAVLSEAEFLSIVEQALSPQEASQPTQEDASDDTGSEAETALPSDAQGD